MELQTPVEFEDSLVVNGMSLGEKRAALRAKYSSEALKPVVPSPVENETPFNVACCLGHLDVVKALDDAGSRRTVTSSWDMSVLHLAAAYGAVEVVEYLASKPDADNDIRAFNQNTALHLACANGRDSVVKVK